MRNLLPSVGQVPLPRLLCTERRDSSTRPFVTVGASLLGGRDAHPLILLRKLKLPGAQAVGVRRLAGQGVREFNTAAAVCQVLLRNESDSPKEDGRDCGVSLEAGSCSWTAQCDPAGRRKSNRPSRRCELPPRNGRSTPHRSAPLSGEISGTEWDALEVCYGVDSKPVALQAVLQWLAARRGGSRAGAVDFGGTGKVRIMEGDTRPPP